jgi:hypothetical protein
VAISVIEVLFILLYFFAFSPVKAGWDLEARLLPFKNLNTDKLILAFSTVFAIQDIIILCLPMPTVWKLKVSPRKRLAIIALFGLGAIPCIAVIFRVAYTPSVIESWDRSWHALPTLFTNQLECAIGVIVPCIPALNTFFVAMRKKDDSRIAINATDNVELKTPVYSEDTYYSTNQDRSKTSKSSFPLDRDKDLDSA